MIDHDSSDLATFDAKDSYVSKTKLKRIQLQTPKAGPERLHTKNYCFCWISDADGNPQVQAPPEADMPTRHHFCVPCASRIET